MAQCKDCKFYKPIDDTKGDCFGHEIPAMLDTEKCPAHAFQPRLEVKKARGKKK